MRLRLLGSWPADLQAHFRSALLPFADDHVNAEALRDLLDERKVRAATRYAREFESATREPRRAARRRAFALLARSGVRQPASMPRR